MNATIVQATKSPRAVGTHQTIQTILTSKRVRHIHGTCHIVSLMYGCTFSRYCFIARNNGRRHGLLQGRVIVGINDTHKHKRIHGGVQVERQRLGHLTQAAHVHGGGLVV